MPIVGPPWPDQVNALNFREDKRLTVGFKMWSLGLSLGFMTILACIGLGVYRVWGMAFKWLDKIFWAFCGIS